jgi:Spy/CpxP family protein refolding chaperone
MLDRLERDLALTPPQRAGIDSIMQRTDSSLRVIRQEMHPRLQQVFESSRAEIASRLTPEQREKFARRPDRSRERR